MTDNSLITTAEAANAAKPTNAWTGEKTAWWVVFGILTVTLVGMLGFWN